MDLFTEAFERGDEKVRDLLTKLSQYELQFVINYESFPWGLRVFVEDSLSDDVNATETFLAECMGTPLWSEAVQLRPVVNWLLWGPAEVVQDEAPEAGFEE